MASHDKISPRKLKGFQDYAPETMRLRLKIIDTIRHHAQLAGFNPIDTPALEYAEVLLGVGGETDKQVYRFIDNGERDVALRFDLTIPFARFVAENLGTLPLPFKRLQMGPVWRAEKPQKGRFREFWQCDLDIIGVNSLAADSEILLCLYSIMADVPCGNFAMVVGHRTVLTALITTCLGSNLSADTLTQALIIIDKLAKIGAEQVIALLAELPGSSKTGAERLIKLLDKGNKPGTDLTAVKAALASAPEALAELEQLQKTVSLVQEASGNNPKGSIVIDLAIARGLGYYTGIVFETMLTAKPDWGSVCSGGRYNHLLDRYVNQEVPGVGGSVGLDRLVAALAESSAAVANNGKNVFIAIATSDAYTYGFKICQSLRSAGFACEIALKEQKLVQQFKYANRLGFPLVVTVGSEEASQQTVNLKNMLSGHEDKNLPWQKLPERIEEISNGSSTHRSPPRI